MCIFHLGSRIGISAALLLAIAGPVHAQRFTVNTTADSGPGSLRQAILDANASTGSPTIDFEDNLGTIRLQSALPLISRGMVVDGGVGNSVSGSDQYRIFFIDAPESAVTIHGLSLIDGRARGGDGGNGAGGGAGLGGAIFVNAGDVTVSSVGFVGNSAAGGNGGVGVGGGGGGLGGHGGDSRIGDVASSNGGGGGGGGLGGNGGDGGVPSSLWSSGTGGGGGGLKGDGGRGSVDPLNATGGGGGGATARGGDGQPGHGGGQGGGGMGAQGGGILGSEGNNGADGLNGGGGGGGGNAARGANGGNGGRGGGGGGGGEAAIGGNGGQGGFGAGGGGGGGAAEGANGGSGGFGGGGGGGGHGAGNAAGGAGGYGGGGGAGGVAAGGNKGGDGGFGGGGGAGGEAAGHGGFGGGDAGRDLVHGGLGGGGAAFGADVFVRSDNGGRLNVIDSSADPGQLSPGHGGGSGAGDGQAGGSAFFLSGGNLELTVSAGHASAINGSIGQSAPSGLDKLGAGTLILTGDNGGRFGFTSGTTVSAGRLIVNNASGTGTGFGPVEVLAGAALGGTGSVAGSVHLADGAHLIAGPGGSKGLTIGGDLALSSKSVFEDAIGSSSNPIRVAGQLSLAGHLDVEALPGFGPGTYALFDYGSIVDNVLRTGHTSDGFLYSIVTDAAHHEVDLVVSDPMAVPEPPSLAVMGFGILALYCRRRLGVGSSLAHHLRPPLAG